MGLGVGEESTTMLKQRGDWAHSREVREEIGEIASLIHDHHLGREKWTG